MGQSWENGVADVRTYVRTYVRTDRDSLQDPQVGPSEIFFQIM